jgi:mercuric ion transport protein
MTMPMPPPPRSLKGHLLLGLAFLVCPCHVPLLLAILAGTSLAGTLSEHFGVTLLAFSVIFAAAVFFGLRALKSSEQRRI